MTGNDPLSDALSGLNNAENAGHLQYTAKPASKLIGNVFEVFHGRGYIGQFEHVQDGKAGYIDVELKGAINKCAPINSLKVEKLLDLYVARCADNKINYLPEQAAKFIEKIRTTCKQGKLVL